MNIFRKCVNFFNGIPDHRDILAIVTLATMAGSNSWKAIHKFAESHAKNLRRMLPSLPSIPNVDTLARTVAKVSPQHMCELLVMVADAFLKRIKDRPRGRPRPGAPPVVIALDGKSVVGAIPRNATKTATHIVNAVCSLITLTVQKVAEKSNEITAFPLLIETLSKHNLLKGAVVTIDAMGCQVEMARKITERGADYLLGLKGNQGRTADEVRLLFEAGLLQCPDAFNKSSFESEETLAGGKVEKRNVTVIYLSNQAALEWFPMHSKWPGIKAVVRVEKRSDPTREGEAATLETRYFITSLTLDAKLVHDITIGHWTVETMHKYLDCDFLEDDCRIARGYAPEILSSIRKLCLNFLIPLKQLTCESAGEVLERLKICWRYLMDVLTKMPKDVCSTKEATEWIQEMLSANYGPIFPCNS
jgi:predicted transposase YbfD/YdcC